VLSRYVDAWNGVTCITMNAYRLILIRGIAVGHSHVSVVPKLFADKILCKSTYIKLEEGNVNLRRYI